MPRILECTETGFAVDEERGRFRLIDTDPRCPDDLRMVVELGSRMEIIDAYEKARREVYADRWLDERLRPNDGAGFVRGKRRA